jgi:hypothetical protein
MQCHPVRGRAHIHGGPCCDGDSQLGTGPAKTFDEAARGADNYLDHVIVRPTSVGLAPCFLCQRFSDEEPPLIG